MGFSYHLIANDMDNDWGALFPLSEIRGDRREREWDEDEAGDDDDKGRNNIYNKNKNNPTLTQSPVVGKSSFPITCVFISLNATFNEGVLYEGEY